MRVRCLQPTWTFKSAKLSGDVGCIGDATLVDVAGGMHFQSLSLVLALLGVPL